MDHDEVKHLEREVDSLRRVYDDLRLKTQRYKKELDSSKDNVRDLELDSQKPHLEDNEYTRQVRSLENKLDKAMIKFNEAQSVRKTYEQILHRLKEEKVTYDYQLNAIEKTIQAKERDVEELIILAGESTHSRDAALNELEKVRTLYEESKKKREKELRDQQQHISMRKAMMQRIKNREELRFQLQNGLSKNNNSERDDQLQHSINIEKTESMNKVQIFEAAFRKIKEATGVSDVNEVIQKIISQETTTEHLIKVTSENQAELERLTELKKDLKAQCEDLKYHGIQNGQHRKMMDSFEEQLTNASINLERNKLKYERLNKILINMKAGLNHLQEKFEIFIEEINGKLYVMTDETIHDILKEIDFCIDTLLKRIRAQEEEASRIHNIDIKALQLSPDRLATPDIIERSKSANGSYRSVDRSSIGSRNAPSRKNLNSAGGVKGGLLSSTYLEDLDINSSNFNAIRPNNQRIDLSYTEDNFLANDNGYKSMGMGMDLSGGHGDEGNIGDLDDEEISREKVKKMCSLVLSSLEKKKKNPKKTGGGKGSSNHANDDDSSINSSIKK